MPQSMGPGRSACRPSFLLPASIVRHAENRVRPIVGPTPPKARRRCPCAIRTRQCRAGGKAHLSQNFQRFPRALGDQMAKQRRTAPVICPVCPGLMSDRPIKDEAVAIGCSLHHDFAVGRIGIGEILIPLGAERHIEDVFDRPGSTLRIAGKIWIFWKGVEQPCVGRWHLPLLKRNGINQTGDAFGRRS